MVEVVAALLWQGNRSLICRRPPEKTRGLLWEFVGGKVEKGETNQQALVRECQEELGITVSVGDVFFEVTHAYPDMTVHLTLYNCSIAEGVIQMKEHYGVVYISPDEIDGFDFCPADVDILHKLKQGAFVR